MAVTFQETPDNYSLSGNPLRFSFSSNQTAQANFSYKVKVEVDGVEVENHKVFPTVGIYAFFDASDIAERYCKHQLPTSGVWYSSANFATIKITVTENYGTPPADQASANSTIVAYKGKLSKVDWLQHVPSQYIFGSNAKWLTNFPTQRYVDLSVDNFFNFITNEESLNWDVFLMDSNMVLIDSKSSGIAATDKISTLVISNAKLLTIGFSQNDIDAATFVQLRLNDITPDYSQTLTVQIDRRCVRLQGTNILFASSIGELINYKFINNRRVNGSVNSVDYETSFGQLDEDGTFSYQRGGLQSKIKQYTESLEVSTDWLDEEEQQWLVKELSTTPLVWVWLGSEWIRCRTSRSSYEYKQDKVDMAYRETFKIEIDNNTSTIV